MGNFVKELKFQQYFFRLYLICYWNVFSDGRRPHLRVIITSPIDTPSPTPGTGYLTTNGEEVREVGGTSAISSRIGAFSEILRRTLRPYYQQIVNRSIRVPWRNATREPVNLYNFTI